MHIEPGTVPSNTGSTEVQVELAVEGASSDAEARLLQRLDASPGDFVAFAANASGGETVGKITGALALTHGACSREFVLRRSSDSEDIELDPPDACQGALRLVPIAVLEPELASAWQQIAGDAPYLDIGGQSGRGGLTRFKKSYSDANSIVEWTKAIVALEERAPALLQPHVGDVPLLGPEIPKTRTDAELLLSTIEAIALHRPSPIREQILSKLEDIRGGTFLGELERLRRVYTPEILENEVLFRPNEVLGFREALRDVYELARIDIGRLDRIFRVFRDDACDAGRTYREPHITQPIAQARARWMTRVTSADREQLLAYYNREGDNLRVVNVSRSIVDDYEYDTDHRQIGSLRHRTGSLGALSPRVCSTWNDRGLMTTRTEVVGSTAEARTQCFAYDENGPWLTRASHPDKPENLLFSRAFDRAGQVLASANDGGEVTTYQYNQGWLSDVVDPSGIATHYEDYDPQIGLPRRIVRDDGGFEQTSELTYDGWGHLATIDRLGFGPSETWAWLDHARLDFHDVMTDDGSYSEEYEYYASGQIRSISGPVVDREFAYDTAGRLKRETQTSEDRTRITCYQHRSDGSVASVIDPNGALWTEQRSYDGPRRTSTLTVSEASDPECAVPSEDTEGDLPSDAVSSTTIDGADRVVESVDGAGISTVYSYDRYGRLFTASQGVDDSRVMVSRYYDELDRPTAELVLEGEASAPSGVTESSALDAIDGALRATFQSYDPAGRPHRTSTYAWHPSAGFEQTSDVTVNVDARERRVQTTAITAEGDHVETVQYDALGRWTSRTDNVDAAASADYPSFLEQHVWTRGPEGTEIPIVRHFRDHGGLSDVQVAGSSVLHNDYGATGRLESTRDEASLTSFVYDGFSKLLSATREPISGGGPSESEEFRYDERARLKKALSGNRVVADFGYDLLGRQVRERRPSSAMGGPAEVERITAYVGASSLVDTLNLPSGRSFAFTYVQGRTLVDTITADASGVQGLAGPAQLVANLDYTPAGNLTSARFEGIPSSSVERTTDGLGRTVFETFPARDHSVTRSYTLGLGLDSLTNNGQRIEYDRLVDGRLDRINAGDLNVQFSYLGPDAPKFVSYGTTLNETRTYDSRGRLTEQDFGAPLRLAYGYGTDGLTRRITAWHDATPSSLLLGLDSIGRTSRELSVPDAAASLVSGSITNEQLDPFANQATRYRGYAHDSSGNWTSVSGLLSTLFNPNPDTANAYRTTADGEAQYDRDGRLLRDGEREYRYDAFGTLSQVTGPDLDCSYETDALGRRIGETCNEATVEFGYDGDNLIAERRGDDLFRTVHADGLNTPVARLSGSSTHYILQDKQGSVRALVDASGAVRERYSYTAYGETTIEPASEQSPTGNRLAFQGHIYEPATGLYSMRARSYAPKLGRFLSPDPIGVRGGANLYAFASNRPGDVWDPFGLTPQSTPSTDRMPDGLAPLEPCVGPYCESRDARSGFDNFDPRTDEQKIDDAIQRGLQDWALGGCDPTVASCPGPSYAPASDFTSSKVDWEREEARKDQVLRVNLTSRTTRSALLSLIPLISCRSVRLPALERPCSAVLKLPQGLESPSSTELTSHRRGLFWAARSSTPRKPRRARSTAQRDSFLPPTPTTPPTLRRGVGQAASWSTSFHHALWRRSAGCRQRR